MNESMTNRLLERCSRTHTTEASFPTDADVASDDSDGEADVTDAITFDSGGLNFNVGLISLDKNGEMEWANDYDSTGVSEIWGLDMDPEGNTYLTGIFTETVDFGDSDCATTCATWAEGTEGDLSGDSVQCRIYHAGAPAAMTTGKFTQLMWCMY
jgi:hypothetical protein